MYLGIVNAILIIFRLTFIYVFGKTRYYYFYNIFIHRLTKF